MDMHSRRTSVRRTAAGRSRLPLVTLTAPETAPETAPVSAEVASVVEYGEIFTRRWVVDMILDLAGYTADRDLAVLHAVEPACGHGAFLVPMVERLSNSLRMHGRVLEEAQSAIAAFDLLAANVEAARRLVIDALVTDGWDKDEVVPLARAWITKGDYLLRAFDEARADFILGNPPYIRLEDVPADRSAAYRKTCKTMSGRADIYVGFIEVGLRTLKPGGVLGYIVADRWMRNQYGGKLREFVADGYAVDVTVQMHDVDAFEEQVSAYPAVSIIRRGEQAASIVADTTSAFGEAEAKALVEWTRNPRARRVDNGVYEIDRLPTWFPGGDLWPAGSPALLAMIEHLNENYQPLEDKATGTRVGIGIATGADAVYLTKDPQAVEPERLLPLSMAANTNGGQLVWSGNYLVNPWGEDGKPVALEDWPRFAEYMRARRAKAEGRKIAQNRPDTWWRTIDNVRPGLIDQPKLLFPDMRMTSRPVYDPGGLYPHHNLYYVVSDHWDMRVLGGLLFSRVAEATVSAYCVKMRGGTLRFQAQYLRRVRVPRPDQIDDKQAAALADAFDRRDPAAATKAALEIYDLPRAARTWLLSAQTAI